MKTIFITGASSGIGRQTVKHFHKKSWNVIAAMRRPEKETEFSSYENISVVQCDVTDPNSVKQAVNAALEKFGNIDVLVNNAGVYDTKPLELATDTEIANVIDTNIKGVITCIQAVLPHFREKRDGVIINVSSIAGFAAFPFQTIYHASKWAVEGLSESLYYELKEFNIKVKLVEPGMVKTDLYNQILDTAKNLPSEYKNNFSKWHNYLARLIQDGPAPEDCAQTIFKAASDDKWKTRYRSGKDARLLAVLHTLLPLPVFRFIVRKITGLR